MALPAVHLIPPGCRSRVFLTLADEAMHEPPALPQSLPPPPHFGQSATSSKPGRRATCPAKMQTEAKPAQLDCSSSDRGPHAQFVLYELKIFGFAMQSKGCGKPIAPRPPLFAKLEAKVGTPGLSSPLPTAPAPNLERAQVCYSWARNEQPSSGVVPPQGKAQQEVARQMIRRFPATLRFRYVPKKRGQIVHIHAVAR